MKLPYHIRPVGEPIRLRSGPLSLDYAGYNNAFYGSGTMALQAALLAAKNQKPAIKKPKCMLAGYGCPDLVSACIGAGIEPVLIDTAPESPFSSLSEITKAQNDECIAIILVNFLGVSPPASLVQDCQKLGLFTIEDRAQAFLSPSNANALFGDAVVFSFGKGKPVSLLGGGLLLTKQSITVQVPLAPLVPLVPLAPTKNTTFSKLKTVLSILAYNLLIRPNFYPLILKLLGSTVGTTRYAAPRPIQTIDRLRLALLASNIEKYAHAQSLSAHQICQALDSQLKLIGATPLLTKNENSRMLRIPLLARDQKTRDYLVKLFVQAGIGATKLYQSSLPEVTGIPVLNVNGKSLPNARDFASRLLTLPCHSGINSKTIIAIKRLIEDDIRPKDLK